MVHQAARRRKPDSMLSRSIAAAVWIAALSAPASGAQPHQLSARERSALRIIESCRVYSDNARELIAQVAKETNDAHTLNGSARKYQPNQTPTFKPLKGPALARAQKMFKSDLTQFDQHARAYKAHTDQVRRTFGQCEASRRAYEANKDAYSLHCGAFHLPNVEAPHICLELDTSVAQANSLASQMKSNMQRLVAAEAELKQSEQRLGNAIGARNTVDSQVRDQHALNLQEQSLAEEFGRLQEEYRQLDVERRALKASGAGVPVSTVHARVRH